MNTPPEAMMLRLAVMNLANAPQAQRRYVQMGLMRFAIANLERLGAEPKNIEGGADFSDEAVALVSELRNEVRCQMEEHEDFLEAADAAPREFLFGHALENEAWEGIRQLARRCYTEIAGEGSALMAIMAR